MGKNWAHRHSVTSSAAIIVGLALAATMMTCGSLALVAWMHFSSQSTVEHGHVSFDLAADGKTIVFAAADDDLYEFDLGTRQVTPLTTTAGKERSPGYSPDGKWIVYAAGNEDDDCTHIYVRSRAGGQASRLTDGTGCSDDCPSFSPDGSQIAFARAHRHRPYSMGGLIWDNWDVYLMNADGSNLRRVTSVQHYGLRWPRFTSDGTQIYYSASSNPQAADTTMTAWVVDLSGKTLPNPWDPMPRGSSASVGWAVDARQSSDGRRFAFVTDRRQPFAYDVAVNTSDGQGITFLGVAPNVSGYNMNPVPTPDGQRVLFLAGIEKNLGNRPIYSLWEVGIDGTNPRQVADSGLFTNPRSWNGHGRIQSKD